MSWANVAGAAVGVIGGAIMGDDASDAAQTASDASARYNEEMAKIAAGQFEIAKEQWELFKTDTLPLIREASQNIQPAGGVDAAISREVGDVRSQYGQAGERAQRQLELSGRNPSDPVHAQLATDIAGNEAGAVAQAMKDARTKYDDQTWQRRLQATALYQNPAGAAAAGAANAGLTYGRAAAGSQGAAQLALQQARYNNEQVGQLGYAGAGLFRDWMRQGSTPNPVPTGGNNPTASSDYRWDMDMDALSGGIDPSFGGYGASPYRDGGAIRRRYAEGGEIQGPGTGTSDSISAVKKPGTYVLSADTVRAVGTQKLRKLMEAAGVRPGEGEGDDAAGVRVAISNGEWAIPPAVTKFHGEEFFNKMQEKYHRPIIEEFGAPGGAANGGAVRERALPRTVEDAIMLHLPSYGRR